MNVRKARGSRMRYRNFVRLTNEHRRTMKTHDHTMRHVRTRSALSPERRRQYRHMNPHMTWQPSASRKPVLSRRSMLVPCGFEGAFSTCDTWAMVPRCLWAVVVDRHYKTTALIESESPPLSWAVGNRRRFGVRPGGCGAWVRLRGLRNVSFPGRFREGGV